MFRWHHPQDICAVSRSSFISSERDTFFLLCLAKQLHFLQFARLRNAAPNLFCWWSSNHAALWLIDRCMDTVIRFPGLIMWLDDHQQTCSCGMQADYNPSATPSIDRKGGVLRYCYRMTLFYYFGSFTTLLPFLEKKKQRWSNSLRFRFASQLSLVCRFDSVLFSEHARRACVTNGGERTALYDGGAGSWRLVFHIL
jgi:hypothetical protein